MAIAINGSTNVITGVAVGGLPDGIVDADMLASGAVGKWTHVNYTSIGTGGSYTFSGIPTDTTAFRITFRDLSSNTGSSGSESYTGLRLGNASGLLTSGIILLLRILKQVTKGLMLGLADTFYIMKTMVEQNTFIMVKYNVGKQLVQIDGI